jgi:hypothetical protein
MERSDIRGRMVTLDEESRISLPLYYDFGSGFIM